MKQFTIYTTEGIFIHVHAEQLERRIEGVLFYVGDKVIDQYPSSHVISVHARTEMVPNRHPQACCFGCD